MPLTRVQRLHFLPPRRSHEPPEALLAAFSFSFFLVNVFVNMSFSFLEILILVQEMSRHSNYVHQLFQSLQPASSPPEMEEGRAWLGGLASWDGWGQSCRVWAEPWSRWWGIPWSGGVQGLLQLTYLEIVHFNGIPGFMAPSVLPGTNI